MYFLLGGKCERKRKLLLCMYRKGQRGSNTKRSRKKNRKNDKLIRREIERKIKYLRMKREKEKA